MAVATRRRAGVNEIIPGKLWQRGHFYTWPASQKHEMLEELGVDVVVNLWHRIDPDLSPEHHGAIYLNYHISPSELPQEAETVIRFLSALLSAGHRMLVHCEAGKGRSVWLVTRLLAAYTGMTREEAFENVREAVTGNSVHGPLLWDLIGGTEG